MVMGCIGLNNVMKSKQLCVAHDLYNYVLHVPHQVQNA